MEIVTLMTREAMMKGYLRTKQVARRFDVHPRTILRWVDAGYFPGTIKKNPKAKNSPVLIPETAVNAFAEEQVITPKSSNN